MQMTLKHMDVALECAAEVLAGSDIPLSRFNSIWQTARGQQDRLGVLAARSELLDYLGAAHIQRDIERFKAALDALLDKAPVFVERYEPADEILVVELSLALLARRRPLARTLAKAVLDALGAEGQTLEFFQAHALAALLDLDYSLAQRIATDLAEACERKAFSKATHQQALHWASAIQRLANGDAQAAEKEIQELQYLHIHSMDRELGKLKRGGASAFAPFDLLDPAVAALLGLVEVFGHSPQVLSEAALACGYGLGLNPARGEG